MNFKMTMSCCTIVNRKDHVQYLKFQRAIPDDCTCSLTEQNILINDQNGAMILSIGHYRYKTKHVFKTGIRFCYKDLFF